MLYCPLHLTHCSLYLVEQTRSNLLVLELLDCFDYLKSKFLYLSPLGEIFPGQRG